MTKHNSEFAKYVSLNILGQLAYSCYTMADTYFVSAKLGAAGLTALNLAFPVFCLINGTGLMLGMGGGAAYSICRSREQKTEGNRTFTGALLLALVFSALFFACGLFASQAIVKALGADSSIFTMTHIYLKLMLLFAPAFIMNSLLQCFVRNDGAPGLAMVAMLVGSLSNIVLDIIFIFPLDMGIFGAILATGLAPIISMLVLSAYFIKGKKGFGLCHGDISAAALGRIISGGMSPCLTELSSGVVMLLFNFILLKIAGNRGVAAFSIVTVVSLVCTAIFTGLSQGVQPLFSKYYGLSMENVQRRLLKHGCATALIISALLYSIIFLGSEQIVGLFDKDGDMLLQAYGVQGLRMYFAACPFMGLNILIATRFLSLERPIPAQIISMSRASLLLIPVSFLLSWRFKMIGLWCSYPVTEFLVCLMAIFLCLRRELRQKRLCSSAGTEG